MAEPENNTKEEVEPEWAKNLKEMLSNLPGQIKEALTPEEPESPPEPEQTDPNTPQEIPVPQPPEREDHPKPEEVEETEEKPKRKSLLKWLF